MLPNAVAVRFADFAAAWLLTYLVHSTVILLAVWAIASRKRVSVTVREILWKSALVGGILTATTQTVVTRVPLGGQVRLAPRTAGQGQTAMRVAVRSDADGARSGVFVMRTPGSRWTTALAVFWLTTAGAGLLWLTIGHARTLRVLGTRTPLDRSAIGSRLRDLLAVARVDRQVELTCSSSIASPVALSGNEICLPRRALIELEPAEQDSMLAHEIAHLVRRDPQWLVIARSIEMVLFFQPLNRLARHRMQEVAEYLCDDWAVARTSRPVTLAKCLAAVAEWVSRAPELDAVRLQPLSAMVESGGSPLVRRVGRILRGGSTPRARTSRVALVGSALGLVLLAAAAPRVSIAGNAGPRRGFTVVSDIVGTNGVMTSRDSLIVLRTERVRVIADSALRLRPSGAAAGAVMRSNDVVYQRVTIEGRVSDSVSGERVWTRRVAAPSDSGSAGAFVIPLTDTVRAGLLVIERKGDQ